MLQLDILEEHDMSKISYVVGFAFDLQLQGVLLCIKNGLAREAMKKGFVFEMEDS